MMEEEEETLFDQEGLLGGREDVSQEKTDRKRRILKTTALSMAFFCLGLCIAIPGPTLLDLGRRVNRDTESMTFIFTARAFGYLIGSIVGGILFDFFDQQVLLFYTMALTAVATAGIPFCTALLALSVLILMQGVAIGVLDTGGNVFCIKIWGKKHASYMQTLHFAFGVGAFLAPLLARPFLNDSEMIISGNLTKGEFYPVNFHLPALSHKSTRDINSLQFWDQYAGNGPVYLHHSANMESGRTTHYDGQALFPSIINRIEREINNVSEVETGLILSTITLNDTASNLTTTAIPMSTTQRAKKPNVVMGGGLSAKHADADFIKNVLQDLKNNPAKDLPPNVAISTVVTTLIPDVNIGMGNETNKNADFNLDNSTQFENGSESLENRSNVEDGATALGTSASTTSTSTTTTTTTPTTTSTATTTLTTTPSTTTTSTTTTSTTTTTTSSTSTSTATTVSSSFRSVSSLSPSSSSADNSSSKDDQVSNATSNGTKLADTFGDFPNGILAMLANMSRVEIAYEIIAVLLLANAVFFLILYWQDRVSRFALYSPTHDDLTRPRDSKCFTASVLILLFFFFLFYVGMEVTFGGLLSTFAVYFPSMSWTNAQGANVAALFWGCLAFGRGIAIFVARCFKPPCMMVTNLCMTVTGAIVLSFTIEAKAEMLWVGTVLLGLGMSSLFPTAISWADTYHPLTGRATAVFVAGSGLGEMIIPILTGYLFDKVDKMALMYMTLVLSLVLSVLYVIMQIVVCSKNMGERPRSRTGFVRLENSEDMADSMDMGMVEIAESSSLGLTETLRRRSGEEETSKLNGNGGGYEVTEFTKLVELSD